MKFEHLAPCNWFPSVPNTTIIHSVHIYWTLYVPGTGLASWDTLEYKERKIPYPHLSRAFGQDGEDSLTYIINKVYGILKVLNPMENKESVEQIKGSLVKVGGGSVIK